MPAISAQPSVDKKMQQDMGSPASIAIYWDFENVHAALYEVGNGGDSYRRDRCSHQPCVVDIEALMSFLRSLGNVLLNRAFANWVWFSAYAPDLLHHSMDLVQLFPRETHAKNGVDIRMCMDILEDVHTYPHVRKVVIVGGDSDYIAVGQKLRQKGIEVIGIGVREATHRCWTSACTTFEYYHQLVREPRARLSAAPARPSSLTEAKKLLVSAVSRVRSASGEAFARMSALKQAMLQMEASFDEASLGFHGFADFISACADVVAVYPGLYEKHVFLPDQCLDISTEAARQAAPLEYYKRILRQQQLRLLDGDSFIGLCHVVCKCAEEGSFASWDDFASRVRAMASPELHSTLSDSALTRLKQLLYKNYVFHFDEQIQQILLLSSLRDPQTLIEHIFRNTISRLLSHPDLHWNGKLVSELLYGHPAHEEQVTAWYEELRQHPFP